MNKKSKSASLIHLPRSRINEHPHSSTNHSQKTLVSRIIVGVIAIACLCVIVTLFVANLHNPERLVKQRIEEIARDYYESHFYPQVASGKPATELELVFERYSRFGFADVSLRQLLLFDSGRHQNERLYLTKYCDENTTKVHFYPEPPYGQRNYRIEFTYSCQYNT